MKNPTVYLNMSGGDRLTRNEAAALLRALPVNVSANGNRSLRNGFDKLNAANSLANLAYKRKIGEIPYPFGHPKGPGGSKHEAKMKAIRNG